MSFRKALFFVSLLMFSFTFAARSAKADQITFNDLTDAVSVAAPAGRSSVTCGPTGPPFNLPVETCLVFLTPPAGATSFLSSTLPAVGLFISEDGTTISDEIIPQAGFVANSTLVEFKYISDINAPGLGESSLGLCATAPGGCTIRENGFVQNAATITWNNGNSGLSDVIAFQSDVVPEVPEPAGLFLFGSGLAIAGGFLRRRRRLVTPSA